MKAVPAKSCPACGERYDTDVLFCPKDGTTLRLHVTRGVTSVEDNCGENGDTDESGKTYSYT